MIQATISDEKKPVVWVTGSGAPRVGQCIARYFAVRGYRVAIHAHHSTDDAKIFAEELEESGTEWILLTGAIEDSKFASNAVQTILAKFGQLDVLVNSAAVWDWKTLEETTKEDVERQFSINTLGSFLCSQAAGLQMIKQPMGGAIVLIGDWAVSRPYPNFSAYFAGKGAIETLTRSLAVELGTRNPAVRVNAILPGPVMLDPSLNAATAEAIRNQALLKRHGEPKHVAEAAFFLANHEFITGVSLPVDGGRSIYAGHSNDAIAHPTHPRSNT